MPDLQCAWQILLQSAGPRANHTLRTLPPKLSAEYAQGRDEAMCNTVKTLLGEVPGTADAVREAECVAKLPMRMGGLGLRSAVRCADAAYWASWADAFHMIHERTPTVADLVVRTMDGGLSDVGCLAELKQATDRLDKEGFWWRPSWSALRDGKRPPEITAKDPGEWPHGWQYWASSISDSHFRKCSLLSGRAAAHRAHLRSHSGWNAGTAIAFAPTAPEYTIQPHLFRVLLLERLQLPLTITEVACEGCQAPLDAHGRRRAACPRSGRLKKRATPIERVLARICREAGARVTFNAFLRDMNVGVPARDGRRIEVLAQDLPCYAVTQLAIDITLRAPLTSAGEAHPEQQTPMGSLDSSPERQRDDLPRVGRRTLQIGGRGHRDWRTLG